MFKRNSLIGGNAELVLAGLMVVGIAGCGDDGATDGGTGAGANAGGDGSGAQGQGADGQGGQGATAGQGSGGEGSGGEGSGGEGSGGEGVGGGGDLGHQWSLRIGASGSDSMARVGVSEAGDVALTGRFAGAIEIGDFDLTASGGQNVFVAGLDDAGTATWARNLGDLFVWDSALAPNGDVVFSGQSLGPNDLGGGPLPANANAFLVKYAADGSHLLTKPFLSLLPIATIYPSFVSIDGAGAIFMGGTFSGTVNFGDGPKTATGFDSWVAKFDAAGNLAWSRAFGGTNNSAIRDIATDSAGGVVAIGEFLGTLTAGGATHNAAGTPSLFIVKYDASGTFVYSHGYPSDVRTDMAIAADGTDIYVTGGFQGTLDLDAATSPMSEGGHDVFLARYDAAGAIAELGAWGSAGTDFASHLTVDVDGGVWLTGRISGAVDFGDGDVGGAGVDAFLAGFDDSLQPTFSASFGDAAEQSGVSIDRDPVAGIVIGATGGGVMSFGGQDLTSAGMNDAFVAKLAP